MGMIQNAINQMIGTTAIAARLNPKYEEEQQKRAQGAKITKEGLAATAGLKDIQESIAAVEKGDKPEYSESELKDIRQRVGQHVSAIGALKTADVEGSPLRGYVSRKGLQSRGEYSDMLKGIESSLNKMELRQNEALRKAGEAAQGRESQIEKFREFSNMFTEGGRYK